MAERLRSIDPLRHDVPIVDAAGRPTPQFMRQWMQTRSVDEAVGVASDSLAGLLDDFAVHGPRHHAGGDLALDLDAIAGILNANKLYGIASLDAATIGSLVVPNVIKATEIGAYGDPEFDFAPAVSFQGGAARIGFSGDAIAIDTYVGRTGTGVFGGLLGTLNRADELGVSGRDSAFHLDRTHHTGTQDATTLTGTLLDARLSTNIPRFSPSPIFTLGLTAQRTNVGDVAIRASTSSGGAAYEVKAGGETAWGLPGSARDLRQRRISAGLMEIDNNAGGAAELDVTGYGLFGGSTVNAQAVLEARSTARGFLPPRMTTTQRDAISATPVAGLTVYNTTTSKVQTWDGVAWQDHW